jgi:ubiquinone/menaquinone biosynthesis C-methylase UbiE
MEFTGERIIPESKSTAPGTPPYEEHAARYRFASRFVQGKEVLDIACGAGYGSKILRQAGALKVVGCDIAEEAVEHAKSYYSMQGITFQIMDAANILLPDDSFDCVVSFETIEHVENYQKAIGEFYRVLRAGGLLIISTPNKDEYLRGNEKHDNPFHTQEFSKDEFLAILKQYSDVQLFSQRLPRKIGLPRKILRSGVRVAAHLDRMNMRRKVLSKDLISSMSYAIDTHTSELDPIPYQDGHSPLCFIAVCKK